MPGRLPVGQQLAVLYFEEYLQENVEDRLKRLNDLIDQCGCGKLGVTAGVRVCQGIPHVELLKELKAKMADVLVMGTEGRTNLMDTIIGSCARKMSRRRPCFEHPRQRTGRLGLFAQNRPVFITRQANIF